MQKRLNSKHKDLEEAFNYVEITYSKKNIGRNLYAKNQKCKICRKRRVSVH